MPEITAKTLYDHFIAEFTFSFPKANPPCFEKKYMMLLKKLNEEQKGQRCLDYIEFTCRNWKLIQKQCGIVGYPNPSILWSFRSSILGLMDEGINRKNSVEYKNDKPQRTTTRPDTKNLFLNR